MPFFEEINTLYVAIQNQLELQLDADINTNEMQRPWLGEMVAAIENAMDVDFWIVMMINCFSLSHIFHLRKAIHLFNPIALTRINNSLHRCLNVISFLVSYYNLSFLYFKIYYLILIIYRLIHLFFCFINKWLTET